MSKYGYRPSAYRSNEQATDNCVLANGVVDGGGQLKNSLPTDAL
jgi:hypothetical protein